MEAMVQGPKVVALFQHGESVHVANCYLLSEGNSVYICIYIYIYTHMHVSIQYIHMCIYMYIMSIYIYMYTYVLY